MAGSRLIWRSTTRLLLAARARFSHLSCSHESFEFLAGLHVPEDQLVTIRWERQTCLRMVHWPGPCKAECSLDCGAVVL